MVIGQATPRWNSGRPLGSLRFTWNRKRRRRCWICKRRTRRLRKQFSPHAGKRRCAKLHSVCLPVAVSRFVVKFGNSNCRWSAAFWFTHAATNIRFGPMIAHGSLLVMIGTRHWNCIMTSRCGITPVPAMGGNCGRPMGSLRFLPLLGT